MRYLRKIIEIKKKKKKKRYVNLTGNKKHKMIIILLCLLCNVRRLYRFFLINRFCFNIVMEKSLRGSTEYVFIYICLYNFRIIRQCITPLLVDK